MYAPLNLEEMTRAAERVVGRHDFTSFCAAGSAGEKMEKVVTRSEWEVNGEFWTYHIAARSFVHHMVRNLVGTFLEVGQGRRTADDMDRIFETRHRSSAGNMAPAKGLFLERVEFDESGEMPQAVIDTWSKIWRYFAASECQYQRQYHTDFELYKSQNAIEIYIVVR